MSTCLATVSLAASPKMKMITQKPEMKMTIPIPEKYYNTERETPMGTFEFFDGVPIDTTRKKVYDYVDRARAVDVYISMIHAVSTYSLLQWKP